MQRVKLLSYPLFALTLVMISSIIAPNFALQNKQLGGGRTSVSEKKKGPNVNGANKDHRQLRSGIFNMMRGLRGKKERKEVIEELVELLGKRYSGEIDWVVGDCYSPLISGLAKALGARPYLKAMDRKWNIHIEPGQKVLLVQKCAFSGDCFHNLWDKIRNSNGNEKVMMKQCVPVALALFAPLRTMVVLGGIPLVTWHPLEYLVEPGQKVRNPHSCKNCVCNKTRKGGCPRNKT